MLYLRIDKKNVYSSLFCLEQFSDNSIIFFNSSLWCMALMAENTHKNKFSIYFIIKTQKKIEPTYDKNRISLTMQCHMPNYFFFVFYSMNITDGN